MSSACQHLSYEHTSLPQNPVISVLCRFGTLLAEPDCGGLAHRAFAKDPLMSQAIAYNDETSVSNPAGLRAVANKSARTRNVRAAAEQLQAEGLWQPDTPLKLRLAHGKPPRRGYVNVDGSATPHEEASCRADFNQLTFEAGTVSELAVDGVLETRSLPLALALLVRWSRWLQPGGRIVICCADIEACALDLVGGGPLGDKHRALMQLFGNEVTHRDGWYRAKLKGALQALGYVITSTRSRHNAAFGMHTVEVTAEKLAHQSIDELAAAAARFIRDALAGTPRPEAERQYAQLPEALERAPSDVGDEADADNQEVLDPSGRATHNNIKKQKRKSAFPTERSLEQGLAPEEAPEGVMDFIALPNLTTEQETETEGRWWQPIDGSVPARRQPEQQPAKAEAKQTEQKHNPEVLQIFDKAEAAAQEGDWQKASELFITMVEKAPEFGPGYVGVASAAFALGDLPTGAMALEHAISIYPENPVLHAQYGVALAHTGHLDRAQEAFLKVLDIEPHNMDALVSLAQLCRATRNFVEAVELLDHAHSLEPDNALVIGAIGHTALELGDHSGALASLRRLKNIAPGHPETMLLEQSLAEK